ncbi:bifunctional lysylphosphatidylglycerol synthetase/lysine--tRNA ligase LysX [Nonomuraea sp. LP-02]|uniref:bifunctional lysylphosphatidylglycerol synthetase/lysine--tRNA ligase LysX n=1 Tax=Nonomuraea sp. LP-02 TaxID=3097960 RepID=UPI002E33097C|nr:bifunctional lysylphosphatidylglycerol synthetase/lysine--tRNA ligase LysX [Nonomuraea sp. LP-02]MED7928929.1 bifunctional lysylphosphatidylglycerol synthetase/lysine--tRNA ligase LysX [Nonomuraea sp. LP-02]
MSEELPEQMRIRREKLDRLRSEGVDPYPVNFPRTATNAEVREKYQGLEPDTATGESVSVAGRVMLSRVGGKLCFATLRDGEADLQVMISLDRVGEESLARWKRDVDLGDHVGITGEVITSRRGELSVLADDWQITAKCLRPLPEKHVGLTDPEARVRQRYVDLIVNDEARKMARVRSATVRAVRDFWHEEGYLEVETPMLQPIHGGAAARPFRTHINAYDMELYLRIAIELYLKRLVVGGVEKVFEINRNFRNEGADSTHNPEFTMIEAYGTYLDYHDMADLTQRMYQKAVVAALDTTVVVHDGVEVDLGLAEWPRVTLYGLVSEAVGEEITTSTTLEELRKIADRREVHWDPKWGSGKLVQELFEALVEHTLVQPTFVMDYPLETSPLARLHRDNPLLTEKWDLIGFGTELGTAYSELNDPIDQRHRLVEQSLLAAGGDPEAMQLDEDFLAALEYGMPPTGGMGAGIDRMIMAFTGKNIRETILFPLVKPTH